MRTTPAGPLIPVVPYGLAADGTYTENAASFSTAPTQYSTVSTFTPVTSDGTVFTLAAGEKGFIQNIQNTALYVKYGASASSSSFNFVLKAGTAANDGNGGSVVIDDFVGAVSIAAATGSPRVAAWKLS